MTTKRNGGIIKVQRNKKGNKKKMTTEVFKELKDFSVSELEEVISLAKEELVTKRAAQRTKLKTDFMTVYDALVKEGIEIHYIDPYLEEDVSLNHRDGFYFN